MSVGERKSRHVRSSWIPHRSRADTDRPGARAAADGADGLGGGWFAGPSHESSLPRRPPYHWLRPPRESVVNALLPWRARADGRLGSAPDPGHGEPPRSKIERGHSERKQRLLETDHRRLRVCIPSLITFRRKRPLASGRIPRVRRIDGPCGAASGDAGELPSSLREDGDSDWTSCVRPARSHSARSLGVRPVRPRPRRCGSDRIGCSRLRDRPPWGRAGADRARDDRDSHSALCPIMRRPRVRARRPRGLVETRSRSVTLVSDRSTGDILGKHGNRRRDPGPFRFDPTPRQTPSIRHRAAADPARRRGRATGTIAGTHHRRHRRPPDRRRRQPASAARS